MGLKVTLKEGECLCKRTKLFKIRTWLSDGLGNAALTVGLDDLRGFFQHK